MTFHDIFQRKKEGEEKKPHIIIDVHEKNSLIPAKLHNKAETKKESLKVGDYIVGETIIERKEIHDFYNALISKRIFDQLRSLRELPSWLLIVEGSPYLLEERQRKVVLGALVRIAQEGHLIQTRNEEETSELLLLLAKKKKGTYSLAPQKKAKTLREQQQQILEAFPGIGPKAAQELLKNYKTLEQIFTAKEKELERILGKRARDFKETLATTAPPKEKSLQKNPKT